MTDRADDRGRDGDRRRDRNRARHAGDAGPYGDPGREDHENHGATGRTGWDDGLIARRAAKGERPTGTRIRGLLAEPAADEDFDGDDPDGTGPRAVDETGALVRAVADGTGPADATEAHALRVRLDALRQLVGLSRTRLDGLTLAEAGRVLDEAAARRGLSPRHTVVAIAGATGSGKSTLFNALAGVQISETGLRRPTTSAPIACSWTDGAAGLLDRLEIPGRLRRRPRDGDRDESLAGLVLIDLPDHDSAVTSHRAHVDRVLALVDAVIWVVDPEKYADAVLHERYLRPLAGHAEITFVVLNQIDRLPADAADLVLDDLRRLLDEDGMALGEHGDPGATVLGLSALTGEGVPELRELLGQFTQERGAATRRISADVDRAALRLRPLYVADGRPEIGERARAEFEDRIAEAVGAHAAGLAAERAWRRNAGKACGTPWLRLWRWYDDKRTPQLLRRGPVAPEQPAEEEVTARQRVEQAVRIIADDAAAGLPEPWAQAVRETAVRGAERLPEELDELAVGIRFGAVVGAGAGSGSGSGGGGGSAPGHGAGSAAGAGPGATAATAGGGAPTAGVGAGAPGGKPPRPAWWPVAVLAQASMTLLQIFGGLWLVGQIVGVLEPRLLPPVLLMIAGIVGGPLVEWMCTVAARGPARRYGQEAEDRLRQAAAGCGRARVLEPVAAELLRYREVREQYATVAKLPTATG
ncbi:GTPase [Streptomyces sp. NPDC093225]|uniref:YfjP family GTPase n=1 Tax=Streptomyces sp. NPDC093225 TaxID=3366034 RepID=UPI0037F21686